MPKANRFKKLVHYVCDHCDDPTKLGATKLNKVLWYIDTFAYRLHGETISGETAYVKRQFGPVPKRIMPTLDQLRIDGKLHVKETQYFGKPKREYISLKPSDDSAFTEEEREIIDLVLRVVCDDHTATSISDLSHDIIWEAAEMGEDIPIYAVLAAQATPPTKEDMKWANSLIKEHAAQAA